MSESSTTPLICWDIEATDLHADGNWILCYGWCIIDGKHVGRINVETLKKNPGRWAYDDRELLKKLYSLLTRDNHGWITWFGRGYDEAFVNTRLMLNKMDPLPDLKSLHIDLWKTAKKRLRMRNNRLATMGEAINAAEHKTPLNVYTWKQAMFGESKAVREMVEHCRIDVKITAEAYLRMKPFLYCPPNLALSQYPPDENEPDKGPCPSCGVAGIKQKRGQYITQVGVGWRYQCMSCGHWYRGIPRKQVNTR